MALPTKRITLSRPDILVILTGLNVVLNGIAEILVNKRRPPDMLYPVVGVKYQPREFSQYFYDRILSLRNRLAASANLKSSKPYLNCFDFAAAALGVRLARERNFEPAQGLKLDGKLENYRRRAKRKFDSRLGNETYKTLEAEWTKFLNFIRFNVLTLRIPRRPFRRQFYLAQREEMLSLAAQVINERCTRPVAEAELSHLVILALSEIRRGRHAGIRVRTLIAHPEAARNFLFEFIKERIPELGVQFEYLSLCEQMAIRSERKALGYFMLPTLPSEHTAGLELDSISEEKVIVRVAKFYKDVVYPEDWCCFKAEAEKVARESRLTTPTVSAESLEEVMEFVKPALKISDRVDQLNFNVDWLVGFLFAINASRDRAAQLVRSGFSRAMKEQDGR